MTSTPPSPSPSRDRASRTRALAPVAAIALLTGAVVVALALAVAGTAGAEVHRSLDRRLPADEVARLVDLMRRDLLLVIAPMGGLLVLLAVAFFAGLVEVMAYQRRRLRAQGDEQARLSVELRRSHERLEALIRDSVDVIAVLGPDGAILYESPAIERMLGYPAATRIGRPFDEVVHPDDVRAARRSLGAVVTRPWAKDTVELRLRHRDGSWRHVEATLTNDLAELAVRGVVVNYRDITEHKRLEEQLAHQALHDPVTGLANRVLFADRVAHALSRQPAGQVVAVLMLDLDDFKAVNDARGHSLGDVLLLSVAQRIAEAVREADTVARLGGDEFGLVIEGQDPDLPMALATRVLEAVRRPVTLGRHAVSARASIGIAVARPGQTPEQLLGDADMALTLAKGQGGDRWVRFDDAATDELVSRLSVRLDVAGALERQELHLEYQPILDLETGRVVMAEALLRWTHPTLGTVAPALFVRLAEETGAIVDMGRWAIGEACVAAAVMASAGSDAAVSVNVSGRQLQEASFVEVVTQALADAGIPADRLVLEMTESVLVADVEASATLLRRLRERGIRLAIDDFGTGYASLDYLRRFPVDILKIDRAFLQGTSRGADDPDTGADLLAMIVGMARGLGMTLVVEGIERPEELERLRRLGAGLGQGYLFAPSMTLDRLLDFARERAAGEAVTGRT